MDCKHSTHFNEVCERGCSGALTILLGIDCSDHLVEIVKSHTEPRYVAPDYRCKKVRGQCSRRVRSKRPSLGHSAWRDSFQGCDQDSCRVIERAMAEKQSAEDGEFGRWRAKLKTDLIRGAGNGRGQSKALP